MSGIAHHGLDGNVVRKHFVVGVEDGAAFSIDDLFMNMLFCGKPSEFIVLDHLQINEPERKKTVKSDKPNADECAASASVPSHLRPFRFTTG